MKKILAICVALFTFLASTAAAVAVNGPLIFPARSDVFIAGERTRYSVVSGCVTEIGEATVSFQPSYLSQVWSFEKNGVDLSGLAAGEERKIYYTLEENRYRLLAVIDESNTNQLAYIIDFLHTFGILEGYQDGSFHPESSISRAEFVKLLTLAYDRDKLVQEDSPFLDCAGHWAAPYISLASRLHMVNGVSETAFSPDTPILFEDAVTIMLRANLSEKQIATLSYPDGFTAAGIQTGIISEDKSGSLASREDVFRMVYRSFNHTPRNGPGTGAKPVVYLYPEQPENISVKLKVNGDFIFTYPEYKDGWNVFAYPDGKILSSGKEYSYLFWEATLPGFHPDFSEGFLVSRRDTVSFLQESLSYLGLTPKEYYEFIVYWAPKLQQNDYNKIYFSEDLYQQEAQLTITPAPDSILRVFMVYEAAEEGLVLRPQELTPFERKGFTVVEWGGYEIR